MNYLRYPTISVRALLILRRYIALYVIWDIISRLSLGHFDLAWYTSNEQTSFLDESDTPHQAPLHRLWFYRGSSFFQCFLFGSTTVAAILYGLRIRFSSILLWLLITAQQNRCMHVHDGSDRYLRLIIFWTCFLPERLPKSSSDSVIPDPGLPLQVLLMYLGTWCNRTIDRFSLLELDRSEWWLPKLSAVHYALSGSFAVRDNWINRLIQSNVMVSRSMTLSAMIIELAAPIGCAFSVGKIFAPILVLLHFGLLLSLRLPHWQLLGMITNAIIWIPHVGGHKDSKKTERKSTTNFAQAPNYHQHRITRLVSRGFLLYSVVNFMGERGWVSKWDNGENSIGEALGISQHWVMYGVASHIAHATTIEASLKRGGTMDVLFFVKTGSIVSPADLGREDLSSRFPSARWERALSQWSSKSNPKRIKFFLASLCHHIDFASSFTWETKILSIEPPGSRGRFATKETRPPTILSVDCS